MLQETSLDWGRRCKFYTQKAGTIIEPPTHADHQAPVHPSNDKDFAILIHRIKDSVTQTITTSFTLVCSYCSVSVPLGFLLHWITISSSAMLIGFRLL